MRKQLLYLSALCLVFFASAINVYSQERSPFNNLGIRIGYGNLVNGTVGLTSNLDDYVDKLSSGFTWDANYYIRLPIRPSTAKLRIGFGLEYSGYYSSGSREYSSDKLCFNSWSINYALFYVFNKQSELRGNMGAGGMYYLNNSKVYGKDRKVTSRGRPALNLGLGYYYFLPSGLGFSFSAGFIFTDMSKVNSRYHGEKIKVKYPEDEAAVNRLNLSLGVSYRF